jgi:hypothetical protein
VAIPSQTIEQIAGNDIVEDSGYQLANNGKLIALGDYFSSPGFTDERGYFFVACSVEPIAIMCAMIRNRWIAARSLRKFAA